MRDEAAVRMKVVTETWGNRTITIGKAFLNKKGIDGELWALPIPNAQGKLRFRIVEDDGPRSLGANLRLKMLYPRGFKDQQGADRTQWNLIGFAVMQDQIEGELFVLPMPQDGRNVVRFVMREDDGRPAAEEGGYQAPRGQGAGKFSREPRQPPQERPQAPQGGFQGGGLRPQHRDGLAGPQGAVYGGAAAQHPADQGGAEDDLPF